MVCAAGPANAGNDAENLACKVSYLWQNWLQIQVVRQEMSKAAEAAIGATWSGGQFWTLLEAGSLLQGLIKYTLLKLGLPLTLTQPLLGFCTYIVLKKKKQ